LSRRSRRWIYSSSEQNWFFARKPNFFSRRQSAFQTLQMPSSKKLKCNSQLDMSAVKSLGFVRSAAAAILVSDDPRGRPRALLALDRQG
jgi:hypothetical protein